MGYVSSIYNCVPVGERPAKCVSCLNSFLVGQENVRKNIIVNRMKPAKCLPVLGAIIYLSYIFRGISEFRLSLLF